MNLNFSERITARLFAGFLITSEVRMHLNSSQAWKNASIEAAHGSKDLIEIKHQTKFYVGSYIPGDIIQLVDLAKCEEAMVGKLMSYCPKLPRNSCHFRIIPQLLIH